MTTTIPMGHGWSLPSDAVTQVLAFIGRRGSGKTYAAGKVVEGMLDLGAQVVVLDPIGTWYGLRLQADGKSEGYDIPVFGGRHGDIPLEPGAGSLVADVVIDRNLPVVLDVSQFRKGARKQFVTDFAEQLFQRKKARPGAVHLVIEEAQVFSPQRTARGEERMLGAMEDLVRLGRNFGIGASLISQRPQSVNKEVLNQAEALFLFQTTGPQERKAIAGWVVEKAIDVSDMVDDMPALPAGTCFLWSPQWLKELDRRKVGAKWSFDASATPKLGAKPVEPQLLAQDELKDLEAAMIEVVETAKANDPKALRVEVAKLRAELRRKPKTDPQPAIAAKRFAGAALQGFRVVQNEAQAAATIAEKARNSVANAAAALQSRVLEDLETAHHHANAAASEAEKNHRAIEADALVFAAEAVGALPRVVRPGRVEQYPAPSARSAQPVGVEARILGALAELEAVGVHAPDRVIVAAFAGYKNPRSKGFANAIGSLRSSSLVQYPGAKTIALTETGRREAPPVEVPASTADLHRRVLALLQPVEQRILQVLLEAYPRELQREAVAATAEYSNPRSKGFANSIGRLTGLGFVAKGAPGFVRAADMLFL